MMAAQPALVSGSSAALFSNKPIRFLNVDTMVVETRPHNQCELRDINGFTRLVALDAAGRVCHNLITTQNAF